MEPRGSAGSLSLVTLRVELRNTGREPVAVIWNRLSDQSELLLEDGTSLGLSMGSMHRPKGVEDCRSKPDYCWLNYAPTFTRIDPGQTATGLLYYADTVPAARAPQVAQTSSVTLLANLIVAHPETGATEVQRIALKDVAIASRR
jgi:hypothetical protein